MTCDLEDIQPSEENPSEQALQNQEHHGKVALILFCPFHDNSIISLDDKAHDNRNIITAFQKIKESTPKYARQHASKKMQTFNGSKISFYTK